MSNPPRWTDVVEKTNETVKIRPRPIMAETNFDVVQ